MANLLKGLKVNGTSYGIDYESLANRPVYKDITMGDYLLEETQLEFAVSGDEGMSAPYATASIEIEPEFEGEDLFILTVDGEEYDCITQSRVFDGMEIYIIMPASGEMIGIQCVKQNGEWVERAFILPTDMAGTHTVSIQRYTKEIKTIDREFLGVHTVQSTGMNSFKIDKHIKAFDLIGRIIMGSSMYSMIVRTRVLENGFIDLIMLEGGTKNYIYNPASGYLTLADSGEKTFDVTENLGTSTTYESDDFIGSALVAGDGDPVMICEAEQSDTVWELTAAEPYLYDSEGNIVHDFSLGAVTFDVSTGDFTCNNGVEEADRVDSPSLI